MSPGTRVCDALACCAFGVGSSGEVLQGVKSLVKVLPSTKRIGETPTPGNGTTTVHTQRAPAGVAALGRQTRDPLSCTLGGPPKDLLSQNLNLPEDPNALSCGNIAR